MNWKKLFHRKLKNVNTNNEINVNIKRAEENLQCMEDKLASDKTKTSDIAKAVASARRVRYRVNRFTAEISDSFRRLNHG